jgi:Tol biopolymer transport system component
VYVPGPDGGPDGHILFVLEETLMAQPFDAGRLELSGDGFPVADPVGSGTILGFYSFSASARGALAYVTSSFVGTSQLTWFDRRGKLLETVGDPGRIGNVTLSPDGARAAIDMRAVGSNSPDIWLVEMSRGTFSRFSSDPEAEFHPVWSPAGDRIAYTMAREGRFHVYHKDAGGGGEAEPMPRIPDSMTGEQLNDWSPDGRFLVVMGQGTKLLDLWALPVSGEEQPFPFLATEFPESAARFSPSGTWLAYQSFKSGRPEIYLRPFPKGDREWKISTGGGQRPRWRGDGRELYFVAPDGNLMAAGVRTGETVEAGVPAPLFKTNLTLAGLNAAPYDVTADGQRFLVLVQSEDTSQRALTVTTNWLAKARR